MVMKSRTLKNHHQTILSAFLLLLLSTLFLGLIYPLSVTLLAQLLFPWQANGSVLTHHGQPVGSLWVGQYFSDPAYFSGRLSRTPIYPYNANASQGPTHAFTPQGPSNIPQALTTASASGLDPDISIEAARFQITRIASIRHQSPTTIWLLVKKHIQPRTLGFMGEERVNVLSLNLALDALKS